MHLFSAGPFLLGLLLSLTHLATAQNQSAPPKDGEDKYWTEIHLKRKSILDLLEEHPACELPFAVFMEMIPWITPRYYSISSSPHQTPGQCSITVAVVEGPARSGQGEYLGVCSSYLRKANVGDTIQAVVKPPAAEFRLPDDLATPLIMIGPGTGVAPFRANLDEKLDLARHAAERLREVEGLEVVAEPELSLLAFRLVRPNQDDAALNRLNEALLERVNARRRVYITGTRVAGRFVLRICVLSFRTHRERLDECVEALRAEAARLG